MRFLREVAFYLEPNFQQIQCSVRNDDTDKYSKPFKIRFLCRPSRL